MKKICTLLFTFFIVHQSQSQTITSAHLPNAGEAWIEFIDSTGSLITLSGTGAGQNWNYASSFNVGDTTGILFRPLADAPAYMNAFSSFPNADMVVLDDALDSSATFVNADGTGLYIDGIYEQGLLVDTSIGVNTNIMDFNADRLLIPTPFSINDTRDHIARFTLSFNVMGFTVNVRNNFVQNFVADATGDLTTPMGTFNNVIRIKEFTYSVDSTSYLPPTPFLPDTVSIHDTTITYLFVHPNSHCLLMSVDVDPITLQPTSASYYDPTVLVGTVINNQLPVTMYPNPAKEEFYLNHIKNNSTIQLFDVTGKLVHSQNLNGLESTIKVNTSDMPSGFYFINLSNSTDGNYYQGKFEVVK